MNIGQLDEFEAQVYWDTLFELELECGVLDPSFFQMHRVCSVERIFPARMAQQCGMLVAA